MRNVLFCLFVILPIFSFSQSLGKKRINNLNNSVVRVLVNDNVQGTGFVFHKDGWIATNWHVIDDAFYDENRQVRVPPKTISVEFNNGESIECEFLIYIVNDEDRLMKARAQDYFILKTVKLPDMPIRGLKLGSWKNVSEGDIVYTSGYPYGIDQRINSLGLFSTKYIDNRSINRKVNDSIKVLSTFDVDAAWMDLSLNKGNSGGPVIRMGLKPEDDMVIGIASFNLNPFANEAEIIAKQIINTKFKENNLENRQTVAIGFLMSAIANNSVGVSGVISIDYIFEIVQLLNLE